MRCLHFLLFLVTQLHGQELFVKSTENTTTTNTTAVPEVLLIEINTTETNSAQGPSPTPEIIPVTLSVREVTVENVSVVAGNDTTTIVVPITVVIPEVGNVSFIQDPIITNETVPEQVKAVGNEIRNQTSTKSNEIPTLIVVDIIPDLQLAKSNFTETTTTTTTTTTPTTPTTTSTPAPSLTSQPTPYSFVEGDKLNEAAINYILSQNVSENLVEDLDEIDSWEPPLNLQRAYPYYLTGFDEENRPIWVSEWGKFDLRKIVEGGNKSMEEFNKYARKAVRIITKSHDLKSTPENPVTQAAFIVDFDGMKLDQYAHLPTVMYALDLAKEHRDIIQKHASRIVIVNTNFIAEAAINLGRNVFGRLFERVEVFGANKSRWVHHLRRIFPADQIPEWYGGTKKSHKPLFIYGK